MFRHVFSRSARSIVEFTLLVLAFVTPVAGQDYLSQGSGSDPFGAFSGPNFGVTPADSFPGAFTTDSGPTLAASGAVTRGQEGTLPENLDESWHEEGKTLVGFVSIQLDSKKDWHIYSPTQGPGGLPTKFKNVVLSGSKEDATLTVGEFRLASPIEIARDADGQILEELYGISDWVAPIYVDGEVDPETVDLSDVSADGDISALACNTSLDGLCVPQNISFSVSYKEVDLADSLAFIAENAENVQAASDVISEQGQADDAFGTSNKRLGVVPLLVIAFLGGMILNITPCVLPVIGLKILSFFDQAGRNRASAFMLNVWYTVGVLIIFAALAFASVGLSFLFTQALFQIFMSAIVFVMAISLMGVWELQAPSFLGGERSTKLSSQEGPLGAVFKGVITTLLAIPCGAPLLSPALDWASAASRQGQTSLVVVVYLMIGLGMASPFLIAGAFPELVKFFPKPGEWMDTFRKTMGYFLLIAVLWIIYSAPIEYHLPTLALLFALWFACWNIGRNQYEVEAPRKKIVGWLQSLIVIALVTVFSFNFAGNPIKMTLQNAAVAKTTRWAIRADRDGRLEQQQWALFSRETLDRELAAGRAVVVDFTADWCMNCKVLAKTVLHTRELEEVFEAKNIATLMADWTNQDAQTPDVLEINELLDAHGARQVPTLMIFRPENPDNPVVLRGLYTKSMLLKVLESIK
ncbi:MAG: protein-disulfide reductase DsbD family protein [Thermoguttaceae bacterium]|jgi:suppressor for copper-sensitivity B